MCVSVLNVKTWFLKRKKTSHTQIPNIYETRTTHKRISFKSETKENQFRSKWKTNESINYI